MNLDSDWTAAGTQVSSEFWRIAGLVGAAIFAALLLFLVVRAIFRQRRYRVAQLHRGRPARRKRSAVGEILPVVVERSDPHPGADWLAALCCLLVGTSLLAGWLPWEQPVFLVLSQFGMAAVGFGLARILPGFKRVFIFEDRATAVAEEQAFQEFYANGLHKTEAATGVLLFVSVLEHRVIIMADEGIDSKVGAEFWANTDDAILDGIRHGSLRDGLVSGIERAGERLAEFFPWRDGDRNEIPDRVIVRRE